MHVVSEQSAQDASNVCAGALERRRVDFDVHPDTVQRFLQYLEAGQVGNVAPRVGDAVGRQFGTVAEYDRVEAATFECRDMHVPVVFGDDGEVTGIVANEWCYREIEICQDDAVKVAAGGNGPLISREVGSC